LNHDESCSATTLRRRRGEWIEEGMMDELEGMAFEAYDRAIGMELVAARYLLEETPGCPDPPRGQPAPLRGGFACPGRH